MKIIYVDVDTLRADHTGPYGYARDITPNLDAMARDSVSFENYYCSDSPCLPSRTALMSGQFGITNGVIGHAGQAAQYRMDTGHAPQLQRPLLGQYLGMAGYYTAAISSFAERHRAHFFLGNFRETIRATGGLGDEPAEAVTDRAIDWLKAHREEENWYLHLTYWDPHTDYLHDQEWTRRAAAAGPAPNWPDQNAIDAHQDIYGPRTARDLHYATVSRTSRVPHNMPDQVRDRADYEHLINGYDGGILYWDSQFGRLRQAIAALGLTDDVAIVVSADHGESFGEQGSYAEHGLANEPVHHLPMIFYWPGITNRAAHRRSDALLYNIDYAPTLCDLLGLPVPQKWQGRSFADAVRGEQITSRDYLVWGHGAHTYQRAVRTRDHLYIRTYHPGCFKAEPESLFNVTTDPYLTENLIAQQPALADSMRSKLQQWWDFYAGSPGALPDPMQTTLQLGPTLYNDPVEYMQHLRATGRAEQADDLDRRLHPNNGALGASWTAQGPLMPPEESAMFKRFLSAHANPVAGDESAGRANSALLGRLFGVDTTAQPSA
ncbi:sulfatase [Mycobacteroides abscessus subsp. bolletii]|uniref:sulfatase family protein n=1 Tax=Mycobacteroides abscessus TaxID=36809 RepID=UPI0009A5B614|nr:sulfatase [Mycobacteroides abscessus]SLF48467.1 sulfatase [Mycobacteroides abscessus subsp. bolletii]